MFHSGYLPSHLAKLIGQQPNSLHLFRMLMIAHAIHLSILNAQSFATATFSAALSAACCINRVYLLALLLLVEINRIGCGVMQQIGRCKSVSQ